MSSRGQRTSGSGSQASARPPRSSSSTPSTAATAGVRAGPAGAASKRARPTVAATSASPSVAATASDAATASAGTTPSNSQAIPVEVESEGGTDTDVIEVEDSVAVGSKRKLTSDVWLEFNQVTVDGKLKAECIHCKRKLAGDGRSGTNHLRGHLKGCMYRQVRDGMKQATLKLGKDRSGTVIVEKYTFNQEVARKELALMICLHEYPLSMVDHAGFRSFCCRMILSRPSLTEGLHIFFCDQFT
ncbi:hypothetical protein EJB05_32754, partial [Eragrostis curvula]